MFQKDYLLRLIQQLAEALSKILYNIETGDIEIAKKQITNTYQLFDNNASYFLKTNIDGIVQFFLKKDAEYLKKVQLLAQLLFYDSKIQEDKLVQKKYLQKAIILLEYYLSNTNEYSFENNNLLIEMKNMMDNG